MTGNGTDRKSQVIALVMAGRAKALSAREWQHRIAGYGYSIRETTTGWMVTALSTGAVIGILPMDAAA